jgi:hypothetical protein
VRQIAEQAVPEWRGNAGQGRSASLHQSTMTMHQVGGLRREKTMKQDNKSHLQLEAGLQLALVSLEKQYHKGLLGTASSAICVSTKCHSC